MYILRGSIRGQPAAASRAGCRARRIAWRCASASANFVAALRMSPRVHGARLIWTWFKYCFNWS